MSGRWAGWEEGEGGDEEEQLEPEWDEGFDSTWEPEEEQPEEPPPEGFHDPRASDHIEQDPAMAELKEVAVWGLERYQNLASTPTTWAWQDYVPSGTIAMIAGQPGGGKTSLLFQLLIARARYGAAFCQVCNREVHPAPNFKSIILIEAEHSDASTARKLLKSADHIGVSVTALNRIITVARKSLLIGDPKWQLIVRLIAAGTVSDVAIDTLARVSPRGADSNDEMTQAEIFDQLAQAIERAPTNSRPTIWLLGHTRKQNRENKGRLGLDDVSGSLQRTGQADAVITVEAVRNDDGMVDHTLIILQKSREDPDEYPPEYEMRVGEAGRSKARDDEFARFRELQESQPGLAVAEGAKALGVRKERYRELKKEYESG